MVGFPVVITLPVQWGEMDAFEHVNNTVYFRYFESARIAYFNALNEPTFDRHGPVGPILAETAGRFRAPLSHPDQVRVGARVTALQDYGFLHEYVVVSEGQQVLAATGTGRIVTYDYASRRKVPLPPSIAAAIVRLEGRNVPRQTSPNA